MIKILEIKNFKSVKYLKLDSKRINIFIGEPNSGKSNILETLGLFSSGCYIQGSARNIRNFVRFERISNLFYDENLDDNIEIKFDDKILKIEFKEGKFKGICYEEKVVDYYEGETIFTFEYDYNGSSGSTTHHRALPFKFYRFVVRENFPGKKSDFLLPPSGENLLAVLLTHKELKSIVNQIFNPFGLKLVLRPQEDKIEILKYYEEVFISYPYFLVSDTLQRIVFYLTAIHSNNDSILAFEEPESHAFPYYTKYLAEIIALDGNNNQYFISTHNPYLLLPILEKSPKDDIGIFITYFEDYQTKVKPLSEEEIEEIMGMEIDVFFNIDRFLSK